MTGSREERHTAGPMGVREEDHRLWVAPIRQFDGVVLTAPRLAEYREPKTGASRGCSPRWLGFGSEAHANARRIAALWNACAGISTKDLESGVVKEMREALEGLLKHACIADAAPEDVDEEDRALERRARAALAKAGTT